MVYQFCLHGILRFRRRSGLLGCLGLSNGVRDSDVTACWLPSYRRRHGLRTRGFKSANGSSDTTIPTSFDGILPICLRGYHPRSYCRIMPLPNELHRMDDLRPSLADLFLYHRSFQHLGRRLPFQIRSHRLFWWIRHSFVFWYSRFCISMVDWS